MPLTNIDSTWFKHLNKEFPALNVARDWLSFKSMLFPKVLLVHYEALAPKAIRKGVVYGAKMKPSKGIIHYAKKFKWEFVLFDESQRLNNRNSSWSKCARQLRHAMRRVVLSGTPIEQTPQDVWGELRFVDCSILGDTWGPFKERFLKPTGFMGKKLEFRWELFDEFMNLIRPVALRVTKEEANILPPNIHWEGVDLFGAQAQMYNEMEEGLVTVVKGKRVISQLAVTTQGKLQQIACGHVIDEEGEVHRIGEAKLRRLRSLLRKLPKPVVIFCRYTEEVFWLRGECLKFSDRVEILHGKTGRGKNKGTVRGELNARFQGGEIDYLVAQIKTGGVGSDLYASKTLIFYSTTFSFIDFDQACSRADLMNKEVATDIYLIYAKATVDEDTFLAVSSKRNVSETVLKRLRGEPR